MTTTVRPPGRQASARKASAHARADMLSMKMGRFVLKVRIVLYLRDDSDIFDSVKTLKVSVFKHLIAFRCY